MSVVEQVAVRRGATVLFCTKDRLCTDALHDPAASDTESVGTTCPFGDVVDVDDRMHQAVDAAAARDPVSRGGADQVPETEPDPTEADAVHAEEAVEPRGTGQATTVMDEARSAELPEPRAPVVE
nr:hypothetical protein GCM10025699_48430 [Microbacterium flavescens]